MDKLEIAYPCEWKFTVFGTDESLLRDAVAELFHGQEYSVAFSKRSKEGKYISLIVTATTVSEGDRLKQFALLGKHPAIKMVL